MYAIMCLLTRYWQWFIYCTFTVYFGLASWSKSGVIQLLGRYRAVIADNAECSISPRKMASASAIVGSLSPAAFPAHKESNHATNWLNLFASLSRHSLYWLRVPERIQYKIAVLTYKVLHDTAPRYLGPLDRVADLHGRRALRCASSSRLVVPMFRLSTVGSRTFNVSGPRIWNRLLVVSAPTFSSFRRRLKLFLFQQSYPDD